MYMKKLLILSFCLLCFTGCRQKPQIGIQELKPIVNAIGKKTIVLSEKELGKPLAKAITVLSNESQEYFFKA